MNTWTCCACSRKLPCRSFLRCIFLILNATEQLKFCCNLLLDIHVNGKCRCCRQSSSQHKFAILGLVYELATGGHANRFASQLARRRVVHFTHRQFTCDQFVSTCVGWPNGEILHVACIELRTNVSSTNVNVSRRKSTQAGDHKFNASRKLGLTCVGLRVRLDRA